MCLTQERFDQMDGFDQAFLIMTGKAQINDPFDKAFTVLKELLRGGRDVMLWGPEAALLSKIIREELQSIAREPMREITTLLTPGTKLDKLRIWKLFLEVEDGIQSAWVAIRSRSIDILESIVNRARSLFINRHDPDAQVMVAKQDWEVDQALAKLELAVTESMVGRSREKLAKLISDVEMANDLSDVQRLDLERKIKAFSTDFMATEATMEADVLLGRLWSYSALTTMEVNGVSTFMSHAEMDNRTCAVCMSLDGVQFDVPTSLTTVRSYFEQEEAIIDFPKLADVSSREVSKLGLTPPYHSRCRCDMVPVGTRFTDLRVVRP